MGLFTKIARGLGRKKHQREVLVKRIDMTGWSDERKLAAKTRSRVIKSSSTLVVRRKKKHGFGKFFSKAARSIKKAAKGAGKFIGKEAKLAAKGAGKAAKFAAKEAALAAKFAKKEARAAAKLAKKEAEAAARLAKKAANAIGNVIDSVGDAGKGIADLLKILPVIAVGGFVIFAALEFQKAKKK